MGNGQRAMRCVLRVPSPFMPYLLCDAVCEVRCEGRMAMDKEGIMVPLLLCFSSARTRPRCMSMPQDCTVQCSTAVQRRHYGSFVALLQPSTHTSEVHVHATGLYCAVQSCAALHCTVRTHRNRQHAAQCGNKHRRHAAALRLMRWSIIRITQRIISCWERTGQDPRRPATHYLPPLRPGRE